MGFRDPSEEEKRNEDDLTGRKIAIFWDGDDVFYNGEIVSYDSVKKVFMVKYDNDSTGEVYEENLFATVWKIWDDKSEDSPDYVNKQVIT